MAVIRTTFRATAGGALIALAGMLVALPQAAHAATEVEGYVWGYQPASPFYVAGSGYEYNSAGQPIEIVRHVVGSYHVRFVGMGVTGGVAHANAYGPGNSNFCTVNTYGARGKDEIVHVRCFDGDGNPADSRFTANFTNRQAVTAPFGYLWSNDPVPPVAGYTPPAAWSYDSTGTPIHVTRTAVGRYQVTLGALEKTLPDHWDGYLRATAYGSAPVRCEVLDPALQVPPTIPVRCYDIDGNAVDSRFTLTYAHGVNVLGGSPPNASAMVLPDPVNPPSVGGWSSPGGAPTATEVAAGSYVVTFPGLGMPAGHAIVNAFGTPPAYCNVAAWWPSGGDQNVWVNCYDAAAHTPTAVYALNVAFTR